MTHRIVLSLGAGVQSTALALLVVERALPRPDVAIFADTGWERQATYRQVERLTPLLAGVGVPVQKVSKGDLRAAMLDGSDYLSIPAFVAGKDGKAAPLRRQCTGDYKLDPILRAIKVALGAKISRNGSVLAPPKGTTADVWIGFSRDEIGRVKESIHPWVTNVHPLLDLAGSSDGAPGWTRPDCERYLRRMGWGDTPRSACIGCPLHGDREWREMRDDRPDEWADAVAFDEALRASPTVRSGAGPAYLHRSLLPLAQAPIDKVSRREWLARQGDLLGALADNAEMGDPDGCSPFGCRSGQPVPESA